MNKIWQKAKIEIFNHKIIYFLFLITFVLGLFVRIWRVEEILGFWYDQGRDAQVIWNIIYNGKLTLIGPTTGIEGIFLGPFYYYFLAPAYFLGGGNPAAAALFLGVFNSLSIVGIFILGRIFFGHLAGIFAAVLLAFSSNMVSFSRWLSHPPLLPFFAIIAIFCLYQLSQGKKWYLLLYALVLVITLQIEAAGAIFFLPATLIFWIFFKPKVGTKIFLISTGVFLILSSSHLLFDLRHNFLISKALYKFLIAERSFQFSLLETIKVRLPFYFETYNNFIFSNHTLTWLVLTVIILSFFIFWKKVFNKAITILLIWIFVPLVGLLFYQGNYGYVWAYYLAGTLPAVFLIVGYFFQVWTKTKILAPLVIFLLFQFFWVNTPSLKNYLDRGIGITFSSQKQALDYIYQDSGNQKFNLDVYVPPVIPYAYDYLVLWYSKTKYGFGPLKEQTALLYTLYEADHPHPERLKSWLDRQGGIGKVVFEKSFGEITVQKRERFKVE